MKLRYIGPGAGSVKVRVIGEYRWAPSTVWVQDVSAQVAANLLSQAREEFEVDSRDPLRQVLGLPAWRVAGMALAGIGSLEDLAGVALSDQPALATELGVDSVQVRKWVSMAKQAIQRDKAPTESEF